MKLLDRLTEQVGGDRELAKNILRKRGHMHSNSEELTSEGKYREDLGAEGRALDRRVKRSGGTVRDYTYDYQTNRTKKK